MICPCMKIKNRPNLEEDARADHCQKCGKCEEVCPQAMSIRDDLERVKEAMENL